MVKQPLLSVSWKDHPRALAGLCKTLLDNNFLVDCTIAAEGQRLKAHRLILSACSPYFQMLFSEESEKHTIVVLKDASFDALKAVIDFVYNGETEIQEGHLEDFLTLAKSLQIKGLNDYPLKDKDKIRGLCSADQNTPQSASNRYQGSCEPQVRKATYEGSPENSSPQHDICHSGGYGDAVQSNSPVLLEGNSSSCEIALSESLVAPIQEQYISPAPDEQAIDMEITVKNEPLFVEPKHEQSDVEDDEPMHGNFDNEISEATPPAFVDINVNQHSNMVLPYSESAHVLPDAASMPHILSLNERGTIVIAKPMGIYSPVPGQKQKCISPSERRQAFIIGSKVLAAPHGVIISATKDLLQPPKPTIEGKLHFCPDCHKAFRKPSILINHRRTHTGEKPYHCQECGRMFNQSSNFRRHQRTHMKQ